MLDANNFSCDINLFLVIYLCNIIEIILELIRSQ